MRWPPFLALLVLQGSSAPQPLFLRSAQVFWPRQRWLFPPASSLMLWLWATHQHGYSCCLFLSELSPRRGSQKQKQQVKSFLLAPSSQNTSSKQKACALCSLGWNRALQHFITLCACSEPSYWTTLIRTANTWTKRYTQLLVHLGCGFDRPLWMFWSNGRVAHFQSLGCIFSE